MITTKAASSACIGAFELKRHYRASMLSALVIAAMFHLCLVGAVLIWDEASGVPAASPANRIDTLLVVDIGPGPLLPPAEPDAFDLPPGTPPVELVPGMIPIPTADEFVIDEPDFPTRAELASLNAGLSFPSLGELGESGGGGNELGVSAVSYPEPEEFIPVDTMPVLIKMGQPEYPEMAQLTKTEGSLWVKALVDIDGSVKKAQISRPSGSKVGFEAAAITAAYESKFRPALQNNRPVAVWVTYKVRFKLAEHQ